MVKTGRKDGGKILLELFQGNVFVVAGAKAVNPSRIVLNYLGKEGVSLRVGLCESVEDGW